MIKNTSLLIDETAKTLNYSTEVVKDVVLHQFNDIKSFLKKPTHAKYRIGYLGTLVGNIRSVNSYLHSLIRKMRVLQTPELMEEFRLFWRYRRMLQEDTYLSSYKKRFGTWHWKKTSLDTE